MTLADQVLELLAKGTYNYRSLRDALKPVDDGALDQALTQLTAAKRIQCLAGFYQVATPSLSQEPPPAPPIKFQTASRPPLAVATEEVTMSSDDKKTKVCRKCKQEKAADQFPKTGKNARLCHSCKEAWSGKPGAPAKKPRTKANGGGDVDLVSRLREKRAALAHSIELIDQALGLLAEIG